MRDEQRGSFFGIGSIIVQQPDGIVIVSTVRGGPSEKVGLRAGDIIREIDGKSTENWTSNAAVQKLRGDKGTVVEVAVQRMGFPGLIRFSITRSEIPSNSVYYSFMLNPTTGLHHHQGLRRDHRRGVREGGAQPQGPGHDSR